MIDNSTQHNKLDGFIKESLKEAEIPYNADHWTEIEQKLNALPHTNSIKKWSFSTNIIIGTIVVLGAGILLYNVIPSSLNNNTPVEEITPPVTALPNESIQPSIPAEQPATAQQNNTPANEKVKEPVTKDKEEDATETKTEKENKKEKEAIAVEPDAKQDTANEISNKVLDSLNQNHTKVSTFGDMIDPKKGFVKETNETDEIKKAAQEKIKSGETDKVLMEIKKDSTKREKVYKSKKTNTSNPADSTKPE